MAKCYKNVKIILNKLSKYFILVPLKIQMEIMKLYHNPRCSKSRQGLAILKEKKIEFEIVEYLKSPLSKNELSEIIKKLNIQPIELVRKNELVWKEKFKGQKLDNDQIINALVENPKLIERPILVNGNLAIVGRPPESFESII